MGRQGSTIYRFEKGEVFGLLGPNGAGKTTTMRMLASLIAPSVGTATICGYDVVRDPTAVRRSIGIMTETPALRKPLREQKLEFYAKLYDIAPADARTQIERYLTCLGLWERRQRPRRHLLQGHETKTLVIARALLHEPPVVILDEPTSALDPEGASSSATSIASLKHDGRTIILCTHNPSKPKSSRPRGHRPRQTPPASEHPATSSAPSMAAISRSVSRMLAPISAVQPPRPGWPHHE